MTRLSRTLLFAALLLALGRGGWGAITLGNMWTASTGNGSSAATLTFTVTTVAGTNSLLYVGEGQHSDPTGAGAISVSFGAQGLTVLPYYAGSGFFNNSIWWLGNPSVNTGNVTVTTQASPAGILADAIQIFGASQSVNFLYTIGSNNNNGLISMTVTAANPGDWLMLHLQTQPAPVTIVVDARWTNILTFNNGNDQILEAYYQVPASGSYNYNGTVTSTNNRWNAYISDLVVATPTATPIYVPVDDFPMIPWSLPLRAFWDFDPCDDVAIPYRRPCSTERRA